MITETRSRGNRYILIGALLAILGTILAISILSARPEPPPPELTVPVVYVANNITRGTSLTNALNRRIEIEDRENICPSATNNSELLFVGVFQICTIPERLVSRSMVRIRAEEFASSELLLDIIQERLGNSSFLTDLLPGDILQTNDLDSSDGLSDDLRAVGVAVNRVTSVGGTVRYGQRVDVLVSYERDTGGDERESVTDLLLQNIEVLATTSSDLRYIPSNPYGDPESYYATVEQPLLDPNGDFLNDAVVTLALTLEDALRLTYMANFADEIRLIVRRTDDEQIREVTPITIDAFDRQ